LKIKDLRKLNEEDLEKRMNELKLELMKERGNKEMGGNIKNPGKIKIIRRDIARIHTLKKERKK
jgi:large subunit ribosomal protein L29